MNFSFTKTVLLVGGGALVLFGAYFGVQAMATKDLYLGLFAVAGVAVGFALIVGRGITVSQ